MTVMARDFGWELRGATRTAALWRADLRCYVRREMALDLFDELKALIRALDANAVDHAVIGALAVAIHGAPRATTDIDLLIDEANLERGLAVARERGFTEATPMQFRDGTEMRRASKISGGRHADARLHAGHRVLAGWVAVAAAPRDGVRPADGGHTGGADRDESGGWTPSRPR